VTVVHVGQVTAVGHVVMLGAVGQMEYVGQSSDDVLGSVCSSDSRASSGSRRE
jgi:hypothetical protein